TGSAGAFSASGPQPMDWDYRRGLWTSTWEWRPPPGAVPDQQFQLDCTVTDGRGGSDTRTFGVVGEVQVLRPGKIVFSSDRDGNWEVYVMNDDGTEQTNLTNDPAWDERARFSPDGSKMVFVSNRTGSWQVFTMNPDGTDVRQLTTVPGWEATYPHWTSDGTRITYSTGPMAGGGGTWDVWIMNADGTNPQPFFADEYSSWDGPTYWSPSGNHVVQMHWAWHGSWDFDLYLLDPSGTRLSNLTDAPGGQNDCFWSPDGTRISFNHTDPATPSNSEAAFSFLDDPVNPTRLNQPYVMLSKTPGWEGAPVWNKDGKRLAFPSDRTGNKDIFLINDDGTGVVQLTTDPGNDDWPHWWGR
ncbi:MAG: hypothetical protein AB1758_34365, partial [Candidatus Eremiobacterota bacterium]